jgi:hypothetical protein
MRRAANQTAATTKAAKTTLLIRTMTIDAESKAGGETNACQAYAKRAPAASAKICLSPQPSLRHSVIVIRATSSITRMVSVRHTARQVRGDHNKACGNGRGADDDPCGGCRS